MRGDELRFRMLSEQAISLSRQRLESRKPFVLVAPIGEERELEPTFVAIVDWLKELGRIGGVNEDRDVQPGTGRPDRIERGIVDRQECAVRFSRRQPEGFRDLADADGACLYVGFELGDRPFGPSWPDIAEVDSSQNADPIAMR